ncbi:MAG: TasA family protein [Clostridia bacterium]
MINKKQKLLIILSCVVILALSFGISYAFLIDKSYKTNSFTVGETVVEVKEEFIQPNELTPGLSFTKKPWVENTGNLPCFVRVIVAFSNNKAEEFCELNYNTGDWEKNADGYYYYNKILEPGKQTSPLFTTVTIKNEVIAGTPLLKTDMIDFEINIYAQSVHHVSHVGQPHLDDEFIQAFKNY